MGKVLTSSTSQNFPQSWTQICARHTVVELLLVHLQEAYSSLAEACSSACVLLAGFCLRIAGRSSSKACLLSCMPASAARLWGPMGYSSSCLNALAHPYSNIHHRRCWSQDHCRSNHRHDRCWKAHSLAAQQLLLH